MKTKKISISFFLPIILFSCFIATSLFSSCSNEMKKGMNIDLEITGENCVLHKSGLKEDYLSVPHTALLTLKQMPMLPQHSDATKIFQITL